MPTLNLLPDNFSPVSNGESRESPTTFTDVVKSGFAMTRDNFNSNSRSRGVAEMQDARASLYSEIVGKPLMARSYSKANPILALGASQDAAAFSPLFTTPLDPILRPDLWGWAQRLHKDDTYTNLHIKELKEKDPLKYQGLLTNEEIDQAVRRQSVESTATFENVASRASDDTSFYGGIIGSFGGAMTDPINVITMPLGAGAAGGVMRAIGTEAAIQAGIETATQPTVLAWQKEIGQEYDLGDASANVMGAAVLGGAFTGVVRGARPTAQATFALMQKSKTFNSVQKQAAGYMSRVAHFREANPNPKVVSELHTDTVNAVNKVVRDGDNPSTANLPMTSKQFNDIDTVNTRGLNNLEKSRLVEVDRFKQAVVSDVAAIGQTVRDLRKEIVDENKGLKLSVSQRGDVATIDKIIVPEDLRGQGVGTKAMNKIIEWADANNKTLALTPSADFGGDKTRLKSFYKGLGFVENKGANKDFEISETFLREPKIKEQPFVEEVKADAVDVPTQMLEIPQPLTNSQTDELLKRLDSVDAEKSQATNFDQLVDIDPKKAITLEDGSTVTLRELQQQFKDDETFLNEISTCAVG